ncbi:MAG: autotransporter outer membrane beta-barrel domain-containing protein [Endozoicomonas sp. (ex Botrylloides leachii)]|nr:autotransporter outer membrane beta-barrel domain-containing protein [Endozoicomonas sp. (ex Botrylloides leachii)]
MKNKIKIHPFKRTAISAAIAVALTCSFSNVMADDSESGTEGQTDPARGYFQRVTSWFFGNADEEIFGGMDDMDGILGEGYDEDSDDTGSNQSLGGPEGILAEEDRLAEAEETTPKGAFLEPITEDEARETLEREALIADTAEEENAAEEENVTEEELIRGFNTVSASCASLARATMQGSADLTRSIFTQTTNRGYTSNQGVSTGDTVEAGGFWLNYLNSTGKQSQEPGLDAYSNKLNGVVVGVESELTPDVKVGVAFTTAKSHVDVKSELKPSVNSDFYALAIYGNCTDGNWFMNSAFSYGLGDHQYKIDDDKAKNKTTTFGFTLGGGYNYALNNQWSVQPNTQFNLINVKGDAVKVEDYKIRANDLRVAELGAGISLVGEIPMDKSTLTTEVGLKHFHNFTTKNLSGSISSEAGSQKLTGIRNQRSRGVANVGVGYALTNSMALGLGYDYDFSRGYKSNSMKAKLSYQF